MGQFSVIESLVTCHHTLSVTLLLQQVTLVYLLVGVLIDLYRDMVHFIGVIVAQAHLLSSLLLAQTDIAALDRLVLLQDVVLVGGVGGPTRDLNVLGIVSVLDLWD